MDGDQEYGDLLALEDLESLLEDLEEDGAVDPLDPAILPDTLSERVKSLGLHSVDDLRTRIAQLHSKLDAEDASY